jgi:FAD/FMN-containing dehydrogenase
MKVAAKRNEEKKAVVSRELRDKIGPKKFLHEEVDVAPYGFDPSIGPFQKPSFVVLPENKEDVRETLKIANKHKIAVTVMSAGTNVSGQCIPREGGMVLDLRRMDKIIEINTDSGYAVIEPGVVYDRFTAALAEKGFRCHVPTAPGGSTPLGNSLQRPTGSLANRHLDSIIDLEVVFPDGMIVNTGSSHFPGTGHSMRYGPFPDLAGLFCCALGTMGIVTKAALRIYPINESNRLNLTAFDNFESAIKFVKDITNNNIPEHCIIWFWQMYRRSEFTYTADWVPKIPPELLGDPLKPPEGIPYNIVTTFMSGYEEAMVVNEKICEKVAKKYGGRAISKEEAETKFAGVVKRHWEPIYLEYHQDRESTLFGGGKYRPWIVFTEPKDVTELEKWAVEKVASLGVRPVGYYAQPLDFGRSMFFRIFIYPNAQDQALQDKVTATYREMFDEAMKKYGAPPFRYRPGMDWLCEQTGEFYTLLKKLKKAVDPNYILNPHIFKK